MTALRLAAGLALLLSPVLFSPALAGSATDPEVSDATGDVNPATALAQLPPEARLPQNVSLYDLVSTYVSAESTRDFTIALRVVDLPDDWVLEEGAAAADPLPALTLSTGERVPLWDDRLLAGLVNLTVHFAIHGQPYRAVAALVDLDLDNPNRVPAVDSAALLAAVVRAADERAAQAEGAVAGLPPLDSDATLAAALREAHDLLAALETQVAALPPTVPADQRQALLDGLAAADEALLGAEDATADAPSASVDPAAARAARNALERARDHVRTAEGIAAGLPAAYAGDGTAPAGPLRPKAPRVLVLHSFQLFGPDAAPVQLGGRIDLVADTVEMVVPKAAAGAPGPGDALTAFRSESTARGALRMDMAPDGVNAAALENPVGAATGALDGEAVLPTFGRDYPFAKPSSGDSPSSTGGRAGGPLPLFRVDAVGPREKVIPPGGVATHTFTIRNLGGSPVSGRLDLTGGENGWSHELSAARWSLDPDAAVSVTLSVHASRSADHSLTSHIAVVPTAGDAQPVDFTTTLDAAASNAGSPGAPHAAKRVPGFEAVALVAGVAALAVLARRRTP